MALEGETETAVRRLSESETAGVKRNGENRIYRLRS